MAPKSKARPSRRAKVESSDGEDEQMAVARSKNRSRRARDDEDDEQEEEGEGRQQQQEQDDEDDDALVLFDPASFGDQPLDPAFAEKKIASFVVDWATLEGKLKEMGGMLEGAAVSAEEHDDQDKAAVAKVDEAMRNLLDIQQEVKAYQAVLNNLKKDVGRNDDVRDVVERYEKATKKELNDYRNKTSRQKYGKVDQYIRFKEVIWEVNHSEEAMPPVRSQIEREEGDSGSDGSDIEIGGVTQNFTCSLTLKPFVDPMTSKVCGHSFSNEALQDYFSQQRKGRLVKCPASGCNHNLAISDFALNKDLAKRTNAAERRKRRRALDDEEEEEAMEVL